MHWFDTTNERLEERLSCFNFVLAYRQFNATP